MRITGLYPALATPVTSGGALDESGLDRLCDFLVERGATGLCLGGATAEYPRFETDERLAVLRRVVRRVPAGTTLLMAIGASSMPRTLDLGRAAFDLGCRAVLLPMPWFFPYAQADLAAYAATIAETLAGPCLLYDLPAFTTGLTPETTIDLLELTPHLVGIKDSSGHTAHLRRFAEARGGHDWSLLIGDDRLGLASVAEGWDGAVSGLAGCCPELLIALHDAARSGDAALAQHCQARVDALIAGLADLPTPWGVRLVLKARGIDTGPLPLPLSPARAAQVASLEAWLADWLEASDLANLPAVRHTAP